MRQHHPLENPSLAPYGFVFPLRQKRLEFKPDPNFTWVDEEKIIARLWDRHNRQNAPRPLPVQTIIHEILPGQATVNRIAKGDFVFEGLPYLTRDILILSSTMQWFGTNVGRCFYEHDISLDRIHGFHPEREFLIKFAREDRQRDMVAFLTHVCTPQCADADHKFISLQQLIHGGCYFDSSSVSSRDRAVVDGLMRWLGRRPGRAFTAEFSAHKKRSWDAARARGADRQKQA